ncbi:MAG TPA: hypothetical protein OIM48_04645 [Clostridiaceae bacterium]|nr:hypothetical protein [Clostridiaceae bacterium]
MVNSCKNILKLILGEKEYREIITKTAKEYKKDNYSLDDFEIIIESYFVAILLIGFSKKAIDIDKYVIKLVDKVDINISIKDFCEKYKKYIDDVEEYKFELLRNLIKENETIEIYIEQSKA